MSGSTPTATLVKLRSPFNGEVLTVPPDWSAEFVEELVKRGFTREDEPKKGKKGDTHR